MLYEHGAKSCFVALVDHFGILNFNRFCFFRLNEGANLMLGVIPNKRYATIYFTFSYMYFSDILKTKL